MKNNKKNSKIEKNGLYIAICCCAVIIAAVGYVGNKNQENVNDNSITENQTVVNTPKHNDVNYKEYISDEIIFTESDAIEIEDEDKADIDVVVDETSEYKNEIELPASKAVEIEESDDEFMLPVKGKIVKAYSDNELIFNEVLSDWRTHNGIDISCKENAEVYASESGVVVDVYNDSLGKNVVIEHENGYKSVYANLSDDTNSAIGNVVKKGDVIGKVGNTALSDFTEESHLHFEILCDEKYVNPEDYLKN